ncbi:hypothetical protein ACP4OV_022067 [Aristida adscensionis]
MEQGSQQNEVVNMTRAMEALSPLLNSPRRTIIQVEVLVTAAAVLLLLQLVLGACKRRWHGSFVRVSLSLCSALMFPLSLYTLSVMQSSPVKSSFYPAWGVLLIVASGGTNIVNQFDFHGSTKTKVIQFVLEVARYGFYLVMINQLLNPITYKESWDPKRVMRGLPSASSACVSALLSSVYLTKTLEGGLGFAFGYTHNGREVAEWMKKHANSRRRRSRWDPRSMEGYSYLVKYPLVLFDVALSSGRIITVGQISDDETLKDVCLSFALFELLKRRYYGLVCAEASLPKTHDFVFKGLLPSENDYKRAFRIVELELGFCYDFFFTKYHSIYGAGLDFKLLLVWFILFLYRIILIPVVGVFVLRSSLVLETPKPIIQVHNTKVDYIITLVVLGTVLTVELLQAVFYLASDWVKVSVTCGYLGINRPRPNAFLKKVNGFLSSITISARLNCMIGQYSVISDCSKYYGKRSLWDLAMSLLEKKRDPVKISDTVKRAIARSLLSTAGKLTNGETSLKHNAVFCWTMEGHSQVEVMLIWHIATEYCHLTLSDDHSNGVNQHDPDRGVAVDLSRYCAYLIADVPELLPYHVADTNFSKRTVVEEAHEVLAFSDLSERYEIMKNLQGTEEAGDPETVFKKGVKLGKQLERVLNEAQRWELMADFWAETIIYVAPSHTTAKQHMQHLENGGEFLTHLWALLSHAGILNLDRDKDQGAKLAQSTAEAV